ncbi:MAG: multiheme c-type cytochrome, partial [Acidobacteriota bacterium]
MSSISPGSRATRTAGWAGLLSRIAAGLLVYLVVSGLPLRLIGFSSVMEWTVLLHTLAGFLSLVPVGLYLWRHFAEYRADALTPSKVLGYCGFGAVVLAEGTGLWVTYLGLFSDRVPPGARTLHLIPSIALAVLLFAHLWPLRRRSPAEGVTQEAFSAVRRGYVGALIGVPVVLLLLAFPASLLYNGPKTAGQFPKDYRMPYGQNRPFAPSLARTESNGALAPEALAGSAACGEAGCHPTVFAEWSVSAHRWSALDPAFQRVQEEMGKQNGPESTRYCGGCHDPISLFSGAKVVFKEKLTEDLGFQEGVSCLSCHAVTKTDVQGNANYVIRPPKRYLFETSKNPALKLASYFLIRSYPGHHVDSLEKRLLKTPEYCAACHKQFVDQEVNNFGWVQLQNQYDNWR